MRFAIYGAGGFGREIIRFIAEGLAVSSPDREAVFVSDFEETMTNGYPLLRLADLTAEDLIVIAVADAKARRAMAARCAAQGVPFGSVKAANVTIYDDVVYGEGAVFCPGTIITSNVRIGHHFHLNLNSYVAHDCRVGDFVTFAPNVACNGNVTIGDDVYVGTGALLKPGITIGNGATIGMGAVVTKDVEPGATVVGNPAKPLAKG